MKRRVWIGAQLVLSCGVAGLAINCGGGERPPTESTARPDSGTNLVNVGPVTIEGLSEGNELLFGEAGFVSCGATADLKELVIRNPNNKVVNFRATMTRNKDYFEVSPATGSVAAGGVSRVQIVPKKIPEKAGIEVDLFGGNLEIATSPTDPPVIVKLRQTARGAIITSGSPKELNFGTVKVGSPISQQYTLTNKGNQEVEIDFGVSTPVFTLDGSAAKTVRIRPGESISQPVQFAPTEAVDSTDTVSTTYGASTTHCAPPPDPLAVKGKGTTSVGVSPGVLAFGQVNCGAVGQSLALRIQSTVAMKFTPSLGLVSDRFTLADASGAAIVSGSEIEVPAASTYMLTVVPNRIPFPGTTTPDFYKDVLTITTDTPGDTGRPPINLNMTARGAVPAFEQDQIAAVGTVNETKDNLVRIINNGNAPGDFSLIVIDRPGNPAPPAGAFSVLFTNPTTVVNGVPAEAHLFTKNPSTFNTSHVAALQMVHTAGSGVLCGPVPSPIPLTATSSAGVSVSLSELELDFGEVDCGTTYSLNGGYKTVRITTLQDTTWIPGLGDNSPFTLANNANGTPFTVGQSYPLLAASPVTVRVIPKAIPSRPVQGVAVNAFGDTLTVTTTVDPIKSLPLKQTARGAMFKFDKVLYNHPASALPADVAFSLTNDGNVDGQWSMPNTAVFDIVAPTTGTLPKGVVQKVMRVKAQGSAQMIMTTTSPLCLDLPQMTVNVPPAPITP